QAPAKRGRTSRLKWMTSGTPFSAVATGASAVRASHHTAGNSRFNIAGTLTGASIGAAYLGGADGGSDHGGTGSDRLIRNALLSMVRDPVGQWQGESVSGRPGAPVEVGRWGRSQMPEASDAGPTLGPASEARVYFSTMFLRVASTFFRSS